MSIHRLGKKKIDGYAIKFELIYESQGKDAANAFLKQYVPKQFWKQIADLVGGKIQPKEGTD